MRLSQKELEASNRKGMALYKELIENGSVGADLGIIVTMPTHLEYGTQLTMPCYPDRNKRKKTSAMQKRTGAYSVSLAKEVTKYDHLLDGNYQDDTDYSEFNAQGDGEGELVTTPAVSVADNKTTTGTRSKGILDL